MVFLDKYTIQEKGIKIKMFHFQVARVPWQCERAMQGWGEVPDPD